MPYLVINHLHRSRLDANREVGEGAQGHEIAGEAWFQFHNFTNYAQNQLRDYFGTSTFAVDDDNDDSGVSVTGVNALLLDMHGYAGYDWADEFGSPLIQWGYRLSDHSTLNPSNYCPLDTRSDGSIGSLTHARWMGGQSYECLVRGPGSMASRVSTLLDANGGLTSDGLCGHGTPSLEFPSPHDLANDPVYCEDMTLDTPDECHYYSGGYDLEVHERMDWENVVGDHFNAMQAELPRCIRFGGSDVREAFADVMSVAVMSFLMELYGDVLALMEDVE